MRIDLKGIVKAFGKNVVVDHVDLSIRDGEFFTLLGPSGCGKTTLLRMIAGFHSPDEGDVLFDDVSVLSIPAHRRDTGMVFQNYALFPHLTVEQNVAYGLDARRIRGAESHHRVVEALASVQLSEYGKRYPRELSGGQQQRVALARALVIRPRVLLMDEPLSNLDAKLRVSMREEIRRIQQSLGITTVYVTHDQEEAMAVSDRIAIFYGGHLQQLGAPMDVYLSPVNRFTSEFMGTCNLLDAVGAREGDTSFAVVDGQRFLLSQEVEEGRSFSLMIRPEWIELFDDTRAQASANRFTGRIIDRMFLGQRVVYRINALGTTMRVDLPSRSKGSMLEPGQYALFSFSAESPVVVME